MPCITTTNDPIIVVTESGRSFRIENPNRLPVDKVEIDGCLIRVGRRCDYLFHFPVAALFEAVLVELKGSGVMDAFEQLEATLRHAAIGAYRALIQNCYIVSSRVPSSGSDIQRRKLQMKSDYAVTVVVKNSSYTRAI